MTAARVVMTTDDHKDLATTADAGTVMIADVETMMIADVEIAMTADAETVTTARTDDAAAPEILTPAAENLAHHAVLNDTTVTAKPLVPGLVTTAVAATTHVLEAPRPSIATYHAANAATTATPSAPIVEIAKETAAETASATTAANVPAASVLASTTAGTRARAARLATPATLSEAADSRTRTATCPAAPTPRTASTTTSGMPRSAIGTGAGAEVRIEIETEIEIEIETGIVMIVTETTAAVKMNVIEIPDEDAADRGVATAGLGDGGSYHLQGTFFKTCIITPQHYLSVEDKSFQVLGLELMYAFVMVRLYALRTVMVDLL